MTVILKDNGRRKLPFESKRLIKFIEKAASDYQHLDIDEFVNKTIKTISAKDEYEAENITNLLVLNALDYVGVDPGQHPDWTYLASRIYLNSLYKKASKSRCYDSAKKYGDFYSLLKLLGSKGIYSSNLLRDYTKEEIDFLSEHIEPEKDKLFTYIATRTLADRYLATDHDKNVYELPQERWMVIAMEIMREESTDQRLQLVLESYWALSNLYMTVATPTLANAGKSYGQLSSCFIDTVDDSLRSIYDSNTDVATLSKNGGGIGVYAGFIRSRGSDIKGFKNVSSGTTPWIKQLNNTGVSVDQLGTRGGAIAIYLDVFHKDIFSFLDLRLNNGDERLRAHDIFTGVCIPDLFMEQVEKRGEWYLFDPHEVKQLMGYYLQDFYDEEIGSGTFRDKYYECVNHPLLSRERVNAIDIMKAIMKSQLETGTPYMFYRDEVNRMNPNNHAGIIYCSNLCSEITQNQNPTMVVEEKLTENDEFIVIYKKPGDFVVCNLSSITLARAYDVLERLIPIQVRMLDNVIDLNRDRLEVLQAVATNRKYRAIGLGQSDLHHLLAIKGIKWESEEAVQFNDDLYERIAYLTIESSMKLAIEKGAYPAFVGSDWQTGKYFEKRGYETNKWKDLSLMVQANGIRNSYLMATAPTGTTSIISGATAGIDPIFKRVYSEEKKNYKIPVTAPDLSSKTFWFYKNAYELDQHWSIAQNAARQKHVDQSISFNLYVKSDIKAKDLLALHMDAWKSRLKTTYYVRSTSLDELADCESCSA
jgi:ribonucleoside-diphosphate reductase alpha chain